MCANSITSLIFNRSDAHVTYVNVGPFEIVQNKLIQICNGMDSLHTSEGWCIQQVQRGDANALGVHFLIHPLGQGTPGNLHVSLLCMLNLAYTSWT